MHRTVILALALLFAVSLFGQTVSLNSAWEFVQDDQLTLDGLEAAEGWAPVNLPHTWNREDAFDEADGYHQGVGWYQKNIFFSKTGKDRVLIKFEGANEHATVYLNGEMAGEHLGGYTAFVVDLTPHIRWEAENQLVVRVSNRMNRYIPPLSMDFTFYGGIYRDVWLLRRDDQYFEQERTGGPGVTVRTPQVAEEAATLELDCRLANRSDEGKDVQLLLTVVDPEGQTVHQSTTPVQLPGNAIGKQLLSLQIDLPILWTPDAPALYRVVLQLRSAEGTLLDEYIGKRGFRWATMDENGGLLLNGKPLKLIGSCRHQDYPGYGSAMPDYLHRRDMELLKAMGANFIRIAHYPQDPAVLEACDELGLLAWEEIPLVNEITVSDTFRQVTFHMLEEMIDQHRNHTSVIMWGLMNEIMLGANRGIRRHPHLNRQQYLDALRRLAQDLHQHAKNLDPDRWTVMAQHGHYELYEEAGLNDITDIVGWNLYYGWYSTGIGDMGAFLDRFHRQHPDKGIIVSEYGGGSDSRLHAIEPRRFDFSVEWQTGIHAGYLPQIRERPHVMGGALWLLADFNSEGRKDAVPHINSKGILNLDRSAKDSYLYYQAANLEDPYLAIGSRGWRIRAGVADTDGTLRQPVFLFTNQPKVRLRLNGKDLGEFEVANFHLRAILPFEAGENLLEARAGQAHAAATFTARPIPPDLRRLAPKEVDLAMNLGAHFYFVDETEGVAWLPEQAYSEGGFGYVGGNPLTSWNGDRIGVDKEIFGSPNEPLFQTHRDSLTAFRADLPAGSYELSLHFAEVMGQRERERLLYNLGSDAEEETLAEPRHFHIRINGETVMRDVRLMDYQATSFRIPVRVIGNEGLTVEIIPKRGGAMLSAIRMTGR